MYTENEKQLYIALLEWLAAKMAIKHGNSKYGKDYNIVDPLKCQQIKGTEIYHGWSSDWQDPCNTLWKAGVFYPDDCKREYPNDTPDHEYPGYPSFFIAEVNVKDIASTLMNGNWARYETIDNVIAHFCECARCWNDRVSGFEVHAMPFHVASPFHKVFSLLDACGYVSKIENKYTWTEKVAIAFKQEYIWHEESYADQLAAEQLVQKQRLEKFQLMYEKMPETWKVKIFNSSQMNSALMNAIIHARWSKEKKIWATANLNDPKTASAMGLNEASEFLEIYTDIYLRAETNIP